MKRSPRISRAVGIALAVALVGGTAAWTAVAAEGATGLRAEYFDNVSLAGEPVLVRTDDRVDNRWGRGGPSRSVGRDNFSVRWSGQVEAPTSGTFTFTTTSDDGVRLWVDGQLLVDNWTDHARTRNQGTVELTAGERVDLRMEYYERRGRAVAHLEWSYPGQRRQTVPEAYLRPVAEPVEEPTEEPVEEPVPDPVEEPEPPVEPVPDPDDAGDHDDHGDHHADPDPEPAPLPADARPWSDGATWGGSVPAPGAPVTVPAGSTVVLDQDVSVAGLTVEGTLVCAERDLELTADWVMVHHGGTVRCGSAAQPFAHDLTLTLAADDAAEDVMGMGTRGILLMGGTLELFGTAPSPVWTRLSDHAPAGATQLSLVESTTWGTGDQVVVTPTDFYGVAETERVSVSSVAGSTVRVASPLEDARWGRLQYVGEDGMTLDPAASTSSLVLDERAEVGNLSRNIVIQGADDALWRDQGFGAHVMVMEGGELRLDGVEMRRMGQEARERRYPVHFHGLSYRADGTELGDATGQFVRRSSIWDSANRCVVVHGTNGVSLVDNICYDVVGHAIFLEDAVEQRNVIEGNLTTKVRNPPRSKALLSNELSSFAGGSSGLWITNPANVVRGNVAADSAGNGIWYALPQRPTGVFKNAPVMAPNATPFGTFETNTTHSNGVMGLQFDWAPVNDDGDTDPLRYRPAANGIEPASVAFEASLPFTLDRLTTYKNRQGALWHRQSGGTLREVVAADNPDTAFQGAADCRIVGSASIGNSLNDANPISSSVPPAGMASYHSSCDVKDHLFVNLPFVPGTVSGALNTSDYYIRPVDKGLSRDTGLRLVASSFGWRMPPVTKENWTLAGALWDPYGYVGPAGRYWVYDDPFLTAGTTCTAVAPAGQNGQSCAGPYYGVSGFILDDGNETWDAMMPIQVTRDNGAVWSVGDGHAAPKLGNMRHAALVKGGTYTLRFPGVAMPRQVEFLVENMYRDDDEAVLAVQYDGDVRDPLVYATTVYDASGVRNPATDRDSRVLERAASVAEVRTSDGDVYYQDAANDLVYLKLRHGLPQGSPTAGTDEDLYRALTFVIADR